MRLNGSFIITPLKEWKLKYKLTNREISLNFGISEVYLSYLLNGERQPSLALALKISKITGIDVNHLFSEEEGGASANDQVETETPDQVYEQNTIKTAARQRE